MTEDERRQDCRECISHREHSSQIATLDRNTGELKGDQTLMWVDIKKKVPYAHFLWALGTILTIVLFASGINYKSMEKVLTSGHQVELHVTEVKGEISNINTLLAAKSDEQAEFRETMRNEHVAFRETILEIQKQIFVLTQNSIQTSNTGANGIPK